MAWLGPALSLPPDYHRFVDQRLVAPFPFGLDVLSNLPFALAGVAGAFALWRIAPRALTGVQVATAALFFAGLLLTAAGSAWYHLAPDDDRLVVDRCAMAVAFAGLLGLAASEAVSERAGVATGLAVLLLGPVSAAAALATGNHLPWAVLQGGGIALVLMLAVLPMNPRGLNIRWSAVLLAYAAAKLLEMNDRAAFELTGGWISGHSLKHAVAALAAAPVIFALGKRSIRS